MASMRRSASSSIARLFLDGKYSDLLIKCQGHKIRAHRAIVCTQSPFFDKACSGGFREEHECTVELPEDDPEILHKFLEFLYSSDVADPNFVDDALGSTPLGCPITSSRDRLGFQLAIAGVGDENDPPLGATSRALPGRSHSTGHTSSTAAAAAVASRARQHDRGGQHGWLAGIPYGEYQITAHSSGSSRSRVDNSPSMASLLPIDEDLRTLLRPETNTQQQQQAAAAAADDSLAALYTYLRLYSMADRYEVPRLRDLSLRRFLVTVREGWPVGAMARTTRCWAADARVADLLRELFDSTPPERADGTVDRLRALACELVAEEYAVARGNVAPVMEDYPALAIGVLDRVVFGAAGGRSFRGEGGPSDWPHLPP